MSRRPPRRLPVVGPRPERGIASEAGRSSFEPDTTPSKPGITPSEPELGAREAEGVRGDADPARTAAGWRYRFTAEGARAEEMATLYRELGFEVAADPVATSVDNAEVCTECYDQSPRPYAAIYTRPRSPAGG